MGRYFGTDGIRAAAAAEVFQPPFLERLAGAALRVLAGERPSGGRPLIVLGRDPRHSGEAIARHLGACWAAAGACVLDAGVVPTPAVALAVREREASFGVVVTASHNPAADNGIKFFGAGGTKLSEALEAALEEAIEAESAPLRRLGGQVERIDGAEDYRRFASGQLPAGALAGCRLVVDCAHGAAAETTPAVLRALGAEVSALGVMPDGHNINAGVGSEAPAALAAQVRATGAHLGLAHDGDGDRVLFVDETGTVVPGDAVLALLARHLLREGALAEQTLVATVMSNFALDRWMERLGGRLVRTPVGDRQVLHRMLEGGFDLGGESSGHLILRRHLPTGDGLTAALAFLRALLAEDRPVSAVVGEVALFPQLTRDLPVRAKVPLSERPALQKALAALDAELADRGRTLVRYSGTENKLRLLAEAEDRPLCARTLGRLEALVGQHLDLA